jgi:hypothetical protein
MSTARTFAEWRLREAAVKAAIEELREDCLDTAGNPMPDGAELFTQPTCGMIRIVLAEIERLNAVIEAMKKEAREAEREFQREARDIAAEARWSEREERGDY